MKVGHAKMEMKHISRTEASSIMYDARPRLFLESSLKVSQPIWSLARTGYVKAGKIF